MTDRVNTFGQWLKQRRKVLGLTQKELAQQAGCAEVTLRKIEAGDFHPSAQLVASLAKAVGASEADLPGLAALARGFGDDFMVKARLLRPQRPNNLAAQLTPLIGRERDIAAMRKRLLSDGARLITLLGPPGVGKTRLALAVAEDVLEQFEHGVFFVRLAPIADPVLVASAIAQALGLQMTGSNPPALQLRAYLEEKHLLLVLDNFEHLVEAAPLVDDLLRRCPWLHVLVTSRQPLRVRGERQMPVLPLALPIVSPDVSQLTAADVLRYSAVALFAERAEAVEPEFVVTNANAAAVAELCRRLDGLPLAIELVAARVKLFSPAELLTHIRGPWLLSADGLRDVSARQKTLRGAIGWSYDLLSPVEQTLFTRLAIFPGGCTLEAAEMVCEDVLSSEQVFDGIASLLDKSLLHRETGRFGGSRYGMLETVREYGLERLAHSSLEADLRRRHAGCFLRLIEEAEQQDSIHIQLNHPIHDDVHNIRAALDWAMKYDTQAALLLAAALFSWLSVGGPFVDGLHMIDDVFALPGASAHTIPRAKALYEAGILLLFSGGVGQAQVLEEESLALSQQLGYGRGEANALLGLGRIAHSGRYDQNAAQHYLEKALDCYKRLGDPGGIAYATVLLGEIPFQRADFPQARALFEESIAVAQHAGFSHLWPWPLLMLSSIASAEGDLEEARSLNEQVLLIGRQLRSQAIVAYTLTEQGCIATRQGDFAAAHAFLDEARVTWKDLGANEKVLCTVSVAFAESFQAEGDNREAVQLYRQSLTGVVLEPLMWSVWLLGLGAVAEALGQNELVARLLGATEAVDASGYHLFPDRRHDYNRLAASARAHLGATRFDVAWTLGREIAFEQVAEEAVSILETSLGVRNSTNPSVVSLTLTK